MPTAQPEKSNRLILLIGAFAILKALLLLIVAMAVHHLINADIALTLAGWVRHIRVDPDNHYLHTAIEKLTGVPRKRLHELSIGTFIYAALFFVEGVGLLLRKRWAEYLTVITTSGLLPIEIYEVCERVTLMKVLLLIVNVAIVAYLVRQIWIGHKAAKAALPIAPAPT
jgi:uncharacterized membrane protein (DUF2068 family)